MVGGVLTRVRRVASLASWTLVDQVLSALSNVLLAVLVARTVDAAGFGAFSAAFLVFSLLLGVNRAAVGQPLQITYSSAGPRRFRSAVRSALGAAVWLGIVAGTLSVLVGAFVGGATGQCLMAMGVCLPGLLVQDTCRMAFFALARPRAAAAIDAAWAVVLFPSLLIVLASGLDQSWLPVALWGVSAALAAVVGAILLHARPRLRSSPRWAWEQRKLTGFLTAEFVLNQGVVQIGILALAVAGTEADVGALRAGQVLFGPLNILSTAAFMFAIPEIARRTDLGHRARVKFAVVTSAGVAAVTGVYALVMLLLPDAVGQALFGDTWAGASEVLLPLSLMAFSAALAIGPAAVLYGIGQARITFRINTIKAPVLVLSIALGLPHGAVGVAWAIALTETALMPLWFVRMIGSRPAGSDAAVPVAAADPATPTTDPDHTGPRNRS